MPNSRTTGWAAVTVGSQLVLISKGKVRTRVMLPAPTAATREHQVNTRPPPSSPVLPAFRPPHGPGNRDPPLSVCWIRIQSPALTPAVAERGNSVAPRATLAVTVPIAAPGSLPLTERKPPL